MRSSMPKPSFAPLPLKRTLAREHVISVIVALVMVVVSITGIVRKTMMYPTEALSIGFVSTDILNLTVGLPLLLVSLWLTRRRSLTGLLCWPGALFYVLYIYTSYLAIPTSMLLIPHVILIALSAYSIVAIVVNIDSEAVRQRLDGAIPAKTTGCILMCFGALVFVYQIVNSTTRFISHTPLDRMECVQLIADVVVGCPALLVGGYLLLRRKALGYVAGAGLLLMCSVLFIGVIPAMVLQALAADVPIDVIGILVVLLAGMICFVPFVLFLRGVVRTRKV